MKPLKRNYHWVIAVIVFLQMIFYGGFINNNSLFLIPMSEGLNISRGDLSVAITLRHLSAIIGTLITNPLLLRFGYKKTAIGFLLSSAVAIMGMGFSQSLWMVGICNFLFGLGYGVCTIAGNVRIIKSWFHKHQGLILGATSMATGIGGGIASVVLTQVMVSFSWQYAYFLCALVLLVTIAAFLLLYNDPAEIGLRPYGEGVPLKKPRNTQYPIRISPVIHCKNF